VSTLLEIKQLAANYLGIALADFTVNGLDMFLLAANQVRKSAEMNNDFEFSRKLVKVTVNGSTGGDLSNAVDASAVSVAVKTVIEAGLLDTNGNLAPVIWTTAAESLERLRGETRGATPRYPTDNQLRRGVMGQSRFTFSGTAISRWPKETDSLSTNFDLWMEVYSFQADWTSQSGTVTVDGGIGVTDVNGDYTPFGDYNSHPIFHRVGTLATYLLWHSGTAWKLTVASDLGQTLANYHTSTSTNQSPAGLTFTGGGTFTGVITVVANAPTISTSDTWTTKGAAYILWASIVHLNHKWKVFVPRTEGNLPPPQALAAEGLQTLIDWDANQYELFRRHNR